MMDDPNGERTRLGFDWANIHPTPPLQGLDLRRTALVCIDLQHQFVHPDYGNILEARQNQLDVSAFVGRVAELLPRVRRLQDLARWAGMEVIHTRIEALTRDGRDVAPNRREKGAWVPRGSIEAQIVPEVEPVGDEVVFVKSTSSTFSTTGASHVLRILGIETLLLCGVATNGCIELTARDAADIGYKVIVIADCCGAWSGRAQEDTLARLARGASGIEVRSSDEVAALIRAATQTGIAR